MKKGAQVHEQKAVKHVVVLSRMTYNVTSRKAIRADPSNEANQPERTPYYQQRRGSARVIAADQRTYKIMKSTKVIDSFDL